MIDLTAIREGDIVEIVDPLRRSHIALVEKLTRDGNLVVRRRHTSKAYAKLEKSQWGIPFHIKLGQVVKVLARI